VSAAVLAGNESMTGHTIVIVTTKRDENGNLKANWYFKRNDNSVLGMTNTE
jgi:hypothetical protein